MKKTLKRTGAIGLAAATIVTGLSFGPAAVAAPSPNTNPDQQHSALQSTPTGEKVKLVFQAGSSTFYAPTFSYANAVVTGYTTHTTEAAAERAAVAFDVLSSSDGWFQLQDPTSKKCVTSISSNVFKPALTAVYKTACDNSDATRFQVKGDRLVAEAHPGMSITGPTSWVDVTENPTYTWNSLAFGTGPHLGLVSDVDAISSGLSAKVDSVDLAKRKAVVSGYAAARSFVVINGEEEVQAGEDGTWSGTASGLKLGSNTVTLEQYENSVKTDETSIEVPLEVRPVSGAVSFPADLDQDAVLSGAAQPGATVIVTDVEGAEIARANASAGAGIWSTPIPAPNAGGDYDVRIYQQIDGEDNGEIIRTVSYGAAVTVTSPVEGMAHDGGPVRMTGRGEPGAQVVVREQGSTTVLGTKQVLQSGGWTLDTTNVDDRKHVLEVTQTGKGNNTTRFMVTLNPENDGVTQPFELTTPADKSTVIAPSNEVTFTGKGTTGAQVEIMNASNSRVIGTDEIGQDGTWTTSGVVGFGDQKIRAKVTTNGQVQNTYIDIRVAASAGVTQPFELSTPADKSTVVAPTNEVTFTGKGTTDAVVEIMNASNNRVIASTTVGSDGTWSKAGLVGFGDQKIRAKVTTNGVVQNVWIDIRVEASAGVTQPFALTSPLDGEEVIAPTNKVDFTGTGTTGDSVAIINTYNNRVVATTSIGTAGTWTKSGVLGFGTQNLRATVTHQGVPTDHAFSVVVKAAAGVERPFAITTPENGATVVAPDNQVTFSGSGTTGARVTLTTGSGRPVINTVVREDGTWSDSGFLGHQYYELTTSYTTVGGTPVTGTTTLTVKASDAVINPFAITTPANGSTVVAPNNIVTFTGTGAADATVELINDPGGQFERVVARAIVRPDGTWTASGGLSHQFYTLGYTHTPGTEGGTPANGTTTLTVAAQ